MGPRGANRNYTYSKITHINSQEGNMLKSVLRASCSSRYLLNVYVPTFNFF